MHINEALAMDTTSTIAFDLLAASLLKSSTIQMFEENTSKTISAMVSFHLQ